MSNRITVDNMAEYFDEVPDDLSCFDFNLKNGKKTIKDFFKVKYKNSWCRYYDDDEDSCKTHFFLIYSQSMFIISKIKKELKAIEEIGNIDKNWASETITKHEGGNILESRGTNEQNNVTLDSRGIIVGNLTGSVDDSQLPSIEGVGDIIKKSEEKIWGYIDPNARQRTQNLNIESGSNAINYLGGSSDNNTSRGSNIGNSVSRTSNASEDWRIFLTVKLPDLRDEFLDKFNELFIF